MIITQQQEQQCPRTIFHVWQFAARATRMHKESAQKDGIRHILFRSLLFSNNIATALKHPARFDERDIPDT